jgi:subtilisin family serine protease
MRRRVIVVSLLILGAGLVPAETAVGAERPVTGAVRSQQDPAARALPPRTAGGEAPLLDAGGASVVPDRYIVILAGQHTSAARAATEATATARGATVHYRYQSLPTGFSATLPPVALKAVRMDPNVAYVEPVTIAHGGGVQPNAPWQLDRLDQHEPALNGRYQFPNNGAGVTVFVVDQSVRFGHTEFGGRAWLARDMVGGRNDPECMTHGTAVASLVGGATSGVAKGVGIASVRVLDCANSAPTDRLIAAVEWIRATARRPAIVNWSIWGPPSFALREAIRQSILLGLTYVVIAGNDGGDDACDHQAGDVPDAITVGATDRNDFRAEFSNLGPCLDLFAPGVDLTAAAATSDTAVTTTFSGTSGAAPLVAGVAAIYLSANPTAGPQQIRDAVVGSATQGVVGNAGAGSPNRLLFGYPLATPAVTANGGLNGMFSGYGNNASCRDWSGGDGTQSTPLPNGRRAWFFADSFLDSPSDRANQPFSFSSVRNAMVIQNGSSLRTITGGNTCQEDNQSLPFWDRYADTTVEDASQSSNAFYWPNDGIVVGGDLIRFYYRNVPTPDGLWTDTHTAIATIPISTLDTASVLKVHPYLMPPQYSYGQHPINWGSALLEDGGWVYIYGAGIIDASNNRATFLARATPSQLANPAAWQFNRGGGRDAWSAAGDQAAARPVHSGLLVENGFSVTKVDGAYWLVQKEPNLNGGDIVAHPAWQPWSFGPSRVRLYTPPEGPRDAAHKHQFYYEVRLHRGLGDGGHLVLSYNVNSTEVSIGCRLRINHEAGIYRPRFVNIPTSLLYVGRADGPATMNASGGERWRGNGGPALSPQPPAAVAAGTDQLAALAPDLGWYDQWAGPQQSNHGCPRLTKTTALSATSGPDGVVTLRWDDYGRDMWYWIYSRDVSLGQPFTKHELWAPTTAIVHGPITSAANNGHVFEYYVVPFAYGDPTGQNNTAPASNVVRLTVQVMPPGIPQNVRASNLPIPRELTVLWDAVTYPSKNVYYALWYWDVNAGETEANAHKISFIEPSRTSWTITGLVSGHQYAFRMEASNLAGVSPPSTIGRHVVY